MKPSLATDAQPPQVHDAPLIFLAGAIKYWWLWECDVCGDLQEAETGLRGACNKVECDGVYAELWGTPYHDAYVEYRNNVRSALIEEGYLTYAPHEAFKGTWSEKAQAVNDAGIAMSDLMLVLSPPGIPTEGTDDEVAYARRVETPVMEAPPWTAIPALMSTLKEMFPRDLTNEATAV